MTEIRRRCNNNGEIDASGIPDFFGIEIGDYIDGLDLSGVVAAPGGTAPQAWNDTYKNNRIVVSGFNTFKNSGDPEAVTKNHILFTFRNVLCQGRMNSTNTNAGGYPATEIRTWLEGSNGDGSGALAVKLKSALGGNYLLTISNALTRKGSWAWFNLTLFLPSESNVFGQTGWGESNYGDGLKVHFPIYQKSTVYRRKHLNGSPNSWVESNPSAVSSSDFAHASVNCIASAASAIGTQGISPVFCVA